MADWNPQTHSDVFGKSEAAGPVLSDHCWWQPFLMGPYLQGCAQCFPCSTCSFHTALQSRPRVSTNGAGKLDVHMQKNEA